jgi:hypothetical protein
VTRPLTSADLEERHHSFTRERYQFVGGLNKSIALGVGTVTGLVILLHLESFWPRGVLWVASLLALVVTHLKWEQGSVLTNARGNATDLILPIALGILEVGLFLVLIPEILPRAETASAQEAWRHWFLVLAGHGLLGWGIVRNRLRNVDVERDFSSQLKLVGQEHVRSLRRDAWVTLGVAFAGAASWGILRLFPADWLLAAMGWLACLGMMRAIGTADRDRRSLEGRLAVIARESAPARPARR